jgi:hypothetical protein
MLPEWGGGTRSGGHGGGDDPTFMTNMIALINNPANNVAFHCYWDFDAGDFNATLSG